MNYRPLGVTGLNVSEIGFGGSSLGAAFKEIDESEGIRAVRTAIDSGINLIDTAPFYGATKAESVLGKALHGVSRENYILATKVGRYGNHVEDFDFSAQRVVESVDESLERLGVEHIDFIQVHDIEFGSLQQIVDETLPALRALKEAGKVRFVGVTALPIQALRYVVEHAPIDQVQSYCHYCLNDTSLIDLLPLLREKGIALFSSAPLSMRLLSDAGPPDWHPAPDELKARCAEAAAYCRASGSSLGKLALQFSVSNPDIPTTIVGTSNPDRVLENIRDISEEIDEELLAAVRKILAPVKNLTWASGLPENNLPC